MIDDGAPSVGGFSRSLALGKQGFVRIRNRLGGFTGDAWSMFYTDGSGNVQEVPLGAAGTTLVSNGAAVAPTMQVAGGSSSKAFAFFMGGC